MPVDAIHSFLFSNSEDSEAVPVASSEFTVLGKQAAARFIADGTSMNSTISKLASEHELNTEQVKRVVEAANNAAFNILFQQNPSYVTFPVADVKEILTMKDRVKTASVAEDTTPKSLGSHISISDEEFTKLLFGTPQDHALPMDKTAQQMDLLDRSKRVVDSLLVKKAAVLSKLNHMQDTIATMIRNEEDTADNIAAHLNAVGAQPPFIKIALARAVKEYPSVTSSTGVYMPEQHPIVKLASDVMQESRDYLFAKNRALDILTEYANELD